MNIRQFIVLLAIFYCGTISAAMYKWVDDDGNIHYTQNMPPHGAKLLQKSQAPKSRPSAPQKSGKIEDNPAAEEQPNQTTTQASTELTPEQQEQYRQTCEHLKKNLALLMEPKRVFVKTKEGTRHYLSDAEREQRILKINKQLPRYCRK